MSGLNSPSKPQEEAKKHHVYFANELNFDSTLGPIITKAFREAILSHFMQDEKDAKTDRTPLHFHEPFAETGKQGIIPEDGELGPEEFFKIAQFDVASVQQAELVFAYANGQVIDAGTLIEVGIAIARGIPVILYRGDFRSCSTSNEILIGPSMLFQVPKAEKWKSEHLCTSFDQIKESKLLKQFAADISKNGHVQKHEPLKAISKPRHVFVAHNYELSGEEPEHKEGKMRVEELHDQVKKAGYTVADPLVKGKDEPLDNYAERMKDSFLSCSDLLISINGTAPTPEMMVLLGIASQVGIRVHLHYPNKEKATDAHTPLNLMMMAAYPEGPQAWRPYFYESVEKLSDPKKALMGNAAKPDANAAKNAHAFNNNNNNDRDSGHSEEEEMNPNTQKDWVY